MEKGDAISRSAVLDAMPKSDVLLRHQVVDVICNSPSIGVAPDCDGHTPDEAIRRIGNLKNLLR